MTLLSIAKRDGTEIKENWDYLQKVKDEIFGESALAVEVYPKSDKVVNRMNMRHLWILPDGFELPFGLGLDMMRVMAKGVDGDFRKLLKSHKENR